MRNENLYQIIYDNSINHRLWCSTMDVSDMWAGGGTYHKRSSLKLSLPSPHFNPSCLEIGPMMRPALPQAFFYCAMWEPQGCSEILFLDFCEFWVPWVMLLKPWCCSDYIYTILSSSQHKFLCYQHCIHITLLWSLMWQPCISSGRSRSCHYILLPFSLESTMRDKLRGPKRKR